MELYHFTTQDAYDEILRSNKLLTSVPESFLGWRRISFTDRDDLDRRMPKAEVRLDLNQELLAADGYTLIPMDYDKHHSQYAYEHEIYCEQDIPNAIRYILGVLDLYGGTYTIFNS